MHLEHLVVNDIWVFRLDGRIIPIGDVQYFEARERAVRAANVAGLGVTTRGEVFTLAAPGDLLAKAVDR